MKHKVLVTGGTGFIGSNIVHELVRREYNVSVLDNNLTGDKNNIKEVISDIEYIEGDITDLKTLKKAFKDVDYVLHQAALPSVPRSIKNPIKTNQNNVTGTLNVLVAAQDSGVRRVVYASSSSAYGDLETLPKREDMKVNPISPYAVTKVVGEQYCKVFYDVYNLETVSLRYFNVFGPRQDPNSQYAAVIPKFIKAMLDGESPIIFGDGEQSRDFSYVQNIVEANILAMTAKGATGEVFNLGCGERTTINELIKKINQCLNTNIPAMYSDKRPGDVRHSLADITKARKILNYTPKYSIDKGLKLTIGWYQGSG